MAGPLKEYNRKRDFRKTKEPSGKGKKLDSKRPVFVVQEHHASHLHYDFRLEINGVLKSWAVPKGPSLNPSEKRLAVQTEDHPLSYADFHGSIPKGEYGGGEVFIWDKGTWETQDKDPATAVDQGRLEFSLRGKKLRGKWILVRTKSGGEKKANWLLIKRHDEEEVTNSTEVDEWPGFIIPQLPRLVTSPPPDGEWIHEMKYDGYRIQAHLRNGIATFYTRNGHDWSNAFPHLLEAVGKLKVQNAILDGEIVALDSKGRSNFQRLQNSLKSKEDGQLRYYVFDLLYHDGLDLRGLPLLERKERLQGLLNKRSPVLFSEHFLEQGRDFFKLSCEHELEGVVSKIADSPYRSGRSDIWLKSKCTARQEFVIGGYTEPKGGRTGIGALLLGVYEEERFRYVGKVGTGFDEKTLKELKGELFKLELRESPFEVNAPKGRDLHWVKPERICEVSFANWTDEGILRAPVFHGLRSDKAPGEIGVELPVENPGPTVSSPKKVLFEEEGVTKGEVAELYQSIAEAMLPYLADRPLSLVRCPSGTGGQCFFQKHFSGNVPASFHTFPVKEGKGEGTYLSITSVQGLLDLVQLNAFEIHAWNCHRDNYLRPDQIVMDFDPGPGVEWKEVVGGAFELKSILDDLELESFVKLTGGKGLHVHVPIAPIYTWDQVKAFAQSLALELVSRNPQRYVANMSKKLRRNKIFVDYLRNGYGATAVVPYSLRARATTAMALPLEWSELRRVKSPDGFTLKKALRKIKSRRRDPWEGMLNLHQEILILEAVA